ncbi:Disease resistance protein [Vitis vinifera]|uniref:Disease resistance protein n=1 Tax=Vitis vinifera TaxID=29760 RepID=A0A438DYA4_VITVI|nr:Disease resistance protein [Vitis vinifera]
MLWATEIAKKCGGLPLALVAVGRALSDKDIDGWQEAAKQLKECKPMNIQDVDADFFSCLKLSFDYLQGEEIKSIFLLCCLFPEDRNIELEYLTRLAMGQGLLEDVETVEEGRRRLGGFEELAKERYFEHYALISLMANNISSLPVGLECPKLHTLLLGGNRGLKIFPDAFFVGMKTLKVLDLTAISKKLYRYSLHITPLPASLQLLTDLRMLHLHHRKLGDISILGKLKKLEILSFFASHISELPKEMGELKNLKLLDLTYCRSLKKIPPNLISGLSALEELYMRGSFQQWDVGGTTIERSSASLSELNSLLNLTTLHVEIINAKSLELKGIDSPIPIGVKMLFERTEDLSLISLLEGSRNILPNLGSRGFNGLTSLSVRNCVEFECIIDTTQGVHPVAFPNIETIHLTHLCGMKNLEIVQITCCQEMQDVFQIEGILVGEEHVLPLSSLRELKLDTLPQLEHLWKGFGAHLSLHNLEVIEIERCNRLRNLFQPSIAQSLFKLEYLKIVDCMELQQIIAEDGLEQEVSNVEDKKSLNLPKLKVLEVEDCKKLKSLFSVSSAQSFLQLKQLKVSGSNELKAIISCECGEISAAVDKFVLPQLSNLGA